MVAFPVCGLGNKAAPTLSCTLPFNLGITWTQKRNPSKIAWIPSLLLDYIKKTEHPCGYSVWSECHLRIWKNPVKSTVCKQQARCFYSNQHKLINTKNAVQNKLSGAFCESLRSYRVYLSYKFIVAVLPVLSSTFSRTFASTFPRCFPAATWSPHDTDRFPPAFGWNRSRTDIHRPSTWTALAGQPPIFCFGQNRRDTGSYNPTLQAGRFSVGRVRSLVIKFRCLGQVPVDHFGHIH